MRFTHFFVDRPIFAGVVSIIIVLLGIISFVNLPVTQYPDITPPSITVSASYPGASAEIAANTVAAVLEQQINGVEHMLYMKSENTSDGSTSITITFQSGTNMDTAQVQVQNRVALAEPQLPSEVQRLGVDVRKNSPDLMMVIHVLSPDGSRNSLYVSNYVKTQILDRLARIPGVGEAREFAERAYAMRVSVDPEKAAELGLTAGDIVDAIQNNNAQVAAGTLDAQPIAKQGAFEIPVDTEGRLLTAAQFGNMIIKQGTGGRVVRLRDVAKVTLAAQDYSIIGYLDGKTALPIGIFQRPGSNALETAAAVKAEMVKIKQSMPSGLNYEIVYDPTDFIQKSIDQIYTTILEATVLVVAVIMLFLQTWRAAIIPIVAIPVSLIGTFTFMALFGFSLNNLSLFGLVLAIGIVVDDAIVVVENIEHHVRAGLKPREAAHKTMDEVGGAVVAIALVLTAVFVPTAFIGGISGAFYQQFALTIATSAVISATVSLSLSPALAALLLKPYSTEAPHGIGATLTAPFRAFGRGFNWAFDRTASGYGNLTRRLVHLIVIVLVVYGGLIALTGYEFQTTPKGFIPNQDQGYLIVVAQLPPGASLSRTDAVMRKAAAILRKVPGVGHTVSIVGLDGSTFTAASNAGIIFVPLAPFSQRDPKGLTANAILGAAQGALYKNIDQAQIFVVGPPPVRGVSITGGWKLFVEDRGGQGITALKEATQAFVAAANRTHGLSRVYTFFNTSTPRVYASVDRTRAEMLHVPINEVDQAFEVYLGSDYVNDFNFLGRTYRVIAQAQGASRKTPGDILKLRVRSDDGAMVPLGSLATLKSTTGPARLARYNVYPAIEVQGSPAPGVSTSQALNIVDGLMKRVLPQGFGYEWTDLALQEKLAGNTALVTFGLAVLFVFLVLAALYESWLLPLAVIMIVPMCLLASLVGINLRGIDDNILVQVGFVVLVGLAAKNAILIVAFARQGEQAGAHRIEAAVEAARRRLRPILMTSLAFVLSVVPLVLATGAGAEMRQALGTAVFSGMLGVTFFGLMFTPAFYVTARWLGSHWERRSRQADGGPPPAST